MDTLFFTPKDLKAVTGSSTSTAYRHYRTLKAIIIPEKATRKYITVKEFCECEGIPEQTVLHRMGTVLKHSA